MHLQFADDDCRWQPAVGMMAHRQKSGRHVFYSMSGDQLSAGTHVLAEAGTAQIEYAMLVDIDGKPISCAIEQGASTGISDLPQDTAVGSSAADSRYTLSGVRTRSQAKGVYIEKGKKHIVK